MPFLRSVSALGAEFHEKIIDIFAADRGNIPDLILILQQIGDMLCCFTSRCIVIQVQIQGFDLRIVLQKLFQCKGNFLTSSGNTAQCQQIHIFPWSTPHFCVSCKTQSVNGCFKNVYRITLQLFRHQVKRITFIRTGTFSFEIAFGSTDITVPGTILSVHSQKHSTVIFLAFVQCLIFNAVEDHIPADSSSLQIGDHLVVIVISGGRRKFPFLFWLPLRYRTLVFLRWQL